MKYLYPALIAGVLLAGCSKDDGQSVPDDVTIGFRPFSCDNSTDDDQAESYNDDEIKYVLRSRYPNPTTNASPAAVDSVRMNNNHFRIGDPDDGTLRFHCSTPVICDIYIADSGHVVFASSSEVFNTGRKIATVSTLKPMGQYAQGCHRLFYVFSSAQARSTGFGEINTKGHIDFTVD